MTLKKQSLDKYRITTLVLVAISALFSILQKPLYNLLLWRGEVTILNAPVLSQNELQTIENHSQPIFTFSSVLFLIEVLLFIFYILKIKKNNTRFFSILLCVNIVSCIYSIISIIKLIVAYSNYNADMMKWIKPIISQYTTNVLISTAYLAAFVFLLIDALKKHKFLNASRIVVLVIAVLGLLSVIMNFTNSNIMYAIVSSYGFLFNLAFLIYYFLIAENTNKITLESELHRLKVEYENGNITDEEYATAKQNVLKNL